MKQKKEFTFDELMTMLHLELEASIVEDLEVRLRKIIDERRKEEREELLDTLSHSPKKKREGVQVVDWEDILIFINNYKKVSK